MAAPWLRELLAPSEIRAREQRAEPRDRREFTLAVEIDLGKRKRKRAAGAALVHY
jgi:hypothetical protein